MLNKTVSNEETCRKLLSIFQSLPQKVPKNILEDNTVLFAQRLSSSQR